MAEFKGKKVIFSPHIHLSGITPTGNINITDTNQVDVTNYATAQIVDENLIPANIADGVTVLGVVGTHSGGGNQPQLNAPSISLSANTITITNPATNGNFVTGYNIYINGTYYDSTSTNTYDLSTFAQSGATSASITATAIGTNFLESAESESKTWYSNFFLAGTYQSKGSSNPSLLGLWVSDEDYQGIITVPIRFVKNSTTFTGTGIRRIWDGQTQEFSNEVYAVCNGTLVQIGTVHAASPRGKYITLDLITSQTFEITSSMYTERMVKIVFDDYFVRIG